MITRVQQLTAMNVSAVREIGIGSGFGTTFAEFNVPPAKALRLLEEQMAQLNGRSTTYRSLSAVRRKLRLAAAVSIPGKGATVEQVTRFVRIEREAESDPGCSYHDETQICPACTS